MRLFVANLPDMDEVEFEKLFTGLSPRQIYLAKDHQTMRFRGFGFVEIPEGDAKRALSLDGMDYKGRKITVQEAKPTGSKPREPRQPQHQDFHDHRERGNGRDRGRRRRDEDDGWR